MKRIVILSAVLLFTLSAAIAQPKTTAKETSLEKKKETKTERVALRKLEGKEVSNVSKNAFSLDFPKATNVNWSRSLNFDEASFTNKDGLKLTAFYDADGKLVGTTQYIKFEAIPLKGQQEIKKHYKDYTIGKVLFFDDNEANETDMVLWASQFDDEDNYFVELTKGKNNIIVRVDNNGAVSFFKQL